MDPSSQTNPMDHPDSRSVPRSEHWQQHLPCKSCQSLDCYSIHGSVDQKDCLMRGCVDCTDLAKIEDEITITYARLSDLVKRRQRIMTKPRHCATIPPMPVEVLSSIFRSVREALFDFKYREHPFYPTPRYQQPSQSPPLLVGAVCRNWREVSLATPELWTDLFIDLTKSAEGQLSMVEEWVRRSGVLPLNITVFPYMEARNAQEAKNLEEISSTIRSLAIRWNDIALSTPTSFWSTILNNPDRELAINSISLPHYRGNDLPPLQLHSLHPKHFVIAKTPYQRAHYPLPNISWDRLVSLAVPAPSVSNCELLQIIRDAKNLKYCYCTVSNEPNASISAIGMVTNHSLVHLKLHTHTDIDIIQQLTLPSLRHLDYDMMLRGSGAYQHVVDCISPLIDRSQCPPMHDLILRGQDAKADPFPNFERLPGVTSLFVSALTDRWVHALAKSEPNELLPCLRTLSFSTTDCSASFWSSLRQLFKHHRPLSKVTIMTSRDTKESLPMDRETFLQLLEVEKSGVALTLRDMEGRNWLGGPNFDT